MPLFEHWAIDPRKISRAHELAATGVPKAQIARKLGVNRPTLHRALQREAAPPHQRCGQEF